MIPIRCWLLGGLLLTAGSASFFQPSPVPFSKQRRVQRTRRRQKGTLPTVLSADNDKGGASGDRDDFTRDDNHKFLMTAGPAFLVFLAIPAMTAMAVNLPFDIGHVNTFNPLGGVDPRYFISGGICAAASHGIATPLDVVKTRIQCEPERFNRGIWNAARAIVAEDGPQALLSGLLPTILGFGFEGALKFGLYESLKPTFVQLLSLSNPTEGYLGASVVAGAVASILLCPMERTRIRLVTDPEFAAGFVACFLRLTKEEGVGSIFYGLPAMLSKQVPYTIAKQVSFELFAGFLYAWAFQNSLAAADVRYEVEFVAAFLASILACLASHPGDVVLTTTYKNSGSSSGFSEVVANVYDQKGYSGFFAGITARFLHVGAIITSQLILYDVIKQLLGLPATGAL